MPTCNARPDSEFSAKLGMDPLSTLTWRHQIITQEEDGVLCLSGSSHYLECPHPYSFVSGSPRQLATQSSINRMKNQKERRDEKRTVEWKGRK